MSASVPAQTSALVPPRFRWAMLALVSLLYASFGIAIWSLAPLVTVISSDLGLSSSQMGLILGAWQLVYVWIAYFAGTVVDRLGLRHALTLGIVVVILSLVLRAMAVDFWSLFLAVALFGLGGSTISTGAPKMAAVWFRGRERGLAAGVYSMAPIVSGILVLAATNSVVVPLTGHWRMSFVVYASLVLLAALAWVGLAKNAPPAQAAPRPFHETTAQPVARPPSGLGYLLKQRNMRVALLLAFATFFMNHGLNNWLPTLLSDRGMSLARAGFVASVPSVAGIVGLLLIPMAARHGYRRATLALLLLAGAASTIGIGMLSGVPLGVDLAVSGIARNPLVPVLTLVLMDTPGVGPGRMGAAGGLLFTAGETGGFMGPFLLGLLRDATGTLFSGLVLLTAMSTALTAFVFLVREERQTTPRGDAA